MKEVDQLWADLESKITTYAGEKNAIKRFALSKDATLVAIQRLQEFRAKQNGFAEDAPTLIHFNRNLGPRFYARFIYFSKVSAFECLKVDQGPGEYSELFEDELAGIRRFFQQHAEFRRYYLSEKTGLDGLYFQDHTPDIIQLDELVVGLSPAINKGCLLVAYMKALDEYAGYLSAAGTPNQRLFHLRQSTS